MTKQKELLATKTKVTDKPTPREIKLEKARQKREQKLKG